MVLPEEKKRTDLQGFIEMVLAAKRICTGVIQMVSAKQYIMKCFMQLVLKVK